MRREDVISPVDDRLFSSFVEHMGRVLYMDIHESGHPTTDAGGFWEDVAALIRPLDLPLIRYPGGYFVSSQRLEDGIGLGEECPVVRRNLAWIALEPNQVGVNEFTGFCKEVGRR